MIEPKGRKGPDGPPFIGEPHQAEFGMQRGFGGVCRGWCGFAALCGGGGLYGGGEGCLRTSSVEGDLLDSSSKWLVLGPLCCAVSLTPFRECWKCWGYTSPLAFWDPCHLVCGTRLSQGWLRSESSASDFAVLLACDDASVVASRITNVMVPSS